MPGIPADQAATQFEKRAMNVGAAMIAQTLLTGRAAHAGVAPLQTGTLNACHA
ncbi:MULTISPECIES: hypothetical protein [Burkholderia]|uniref:hypothetical protein n=1 Tax=Burkholderia TaxID=32008 RepID=UPI00163ACCDB|nr:MULTISPECIES: hypothetical protein [Burkholderia]MBN3737393.1 hypothetical protein [Burkholderia sp. Tr-20355]